MLETCRRKSGLVLLLLCYKGWYHVFIEVLILQRVAKKKKKKQRDTEKYTDNMLIKTGRGTLGTLEQVN